MAADKLEYLNGHPSVNSVSVDLLHKMENGRDVGVDVRIKGMGDTCILVHRSCVMAATGSGRAAAHDVLLPDGRYSVYKWDANKKHVTDTGMSMDCADAAKALADADAHYRRTKGILVALSTTSRNNDFAVVRMAARKNNTITDAYLAGREPGQAGDGEDGFEP